MNNEKNYIPNVQDINPEPDTSQQQWDYFNMVNATEPDRRKHTGSNKTPSSKAAQKKKKARKTQRASRKTNRK